MGSGFSACTGPSSVGVTESARNSGRQVLNKSGTGTGTAGGGGVHSDSCDSGISISEGNRKNKARHTNLTPHRVTELDSEEEMVEGNDVACGTDFVITSTPRSASPKLFPKESAGSGPGPGPDTQKGRLHAHPPGKALRHNAHSSPNLLDHAIHEEDEEAHDGEPEDKRLRAQRPPRPKSAHFRKSRAQTHRGRTARSRNHHRNHHHHAGSVSGGESSADMTSDDGEEGEEDFDSDVLSIPDETHAHSDRPSTLTTVKLGPQFQAKTKISDNTTVTALGDGSHNDDMDWWTEDDGGSRSRDGGQDSSRSQGSSFTLRSNSRVWQEGRVAKKASERSISSILLTTAVELDSAPAASAATNPACFAVTNPEITQHILKVSHRQRTTTTTTTTLATCMRGFISVPADVHDGQSCQARRDLGHKFRQLFMVRPAVDDTVIAKISEQSLEHKMRDLFIVAEAEDARETPEWEQSTENVTGVAKFPEQSLEQKMRELFVVAEAEEGRTLDQKTRDMYAELDAEDGSREPRLANRQTLSKTLGLSAGVSESARASIQSAKLRSLLASSGSASPLNPEACIKLKKRVSFSPDIPDVYKCSKTYRRRTIAIIAHRLRMRNARLAQIKRRNIIAAYTCSLCKKDCIKRVIY